MNFTINKNEFLKGLYLAQSIADRKSTMPALANVLIRSEGNETILCAATDLKVSVIAEIKAQILKEGGISIGAKHLFDIIKGMPEDEIHFNKTENNWAEINAGKAKYRIVGMSDRDFPRLPEQKTVDFKEIDAKTLLDMINKTIISVSSDETRRHLSGIYMEWKNNIIRMVSTDGHRLSKVEFEVGEGLDLKEGIIIPRKGVLEIRRLIEGIDGMCDIGLNEGNFFVRAKDLVLITKLVEAQFPPYKQVIPNDNEKKVVVERNKILECLKRMSIMSTERGSGIRVELSENQLRIASDNPDIGEAQEDIDVEYSGKSLIAGYNARYYIDFLNEIKEEKILLEFNGELDPGLIKAKENDNYIGVIMPMRI